MGCWCLLSYSVMSAISAVVLEKFLLTRFSTKTLYFFTYLIYAICCGIIYFQTSVYVILPLSSSMGMLLTTITTLPYQMLSEFHQDKNYRNQSAAGTKRGLGKFFLVLKLFWGLDVNFEIKNKRNWLFVVELNVFPSANNHSSLYGVYYGQVWELCYCFDRIGDFINGLLLGVDFCYISRGKGKYKSEKIIYGFEWD